MAYASHLSPDALNSLKPGMASARTGMDSFVNMKFTDAHGEGIKFAERALFGRERKAKDRIHWQFPYDKDPKVQILMGWIEEVAPGLGAFGLNKFLQTRERGALVVNADYRMDSHSDVPPFDWLTYESAVDTRDKLIQESIGFYDPAMQVIVFIFLPSKTRNSIAMWRRKITVPNSVRLAHVREIELAKAALRKDYPVFVDELPPSTLDSPRPRAAKGKRGFWGKFWKPFKFKVKWS
ncbi:hypothetical protein DENSPDRAFT_831093 [Dentipellis sp. KUC8613]|nr:hypothetical protein DENSPDRAFT_831093 [Dentipellis sp. KUC8613]